MQFLIITHLMINNLKKTYQTAFYNLSDHLFNDVTSIY